MRKIEEKRGEDADGENTGRERQGANNAEYKNARDPVNWTNWTV